MVRASGSVRLGYGATGEQTSKRQVLLYATWEIYTYWRARDIIAVLFYSSVNFSTAWNIPKATYLVHSATTVATNPWSLEIPCRLELMSWSVSSSPRIMRFILGQYLLAKLQSTRKIPFWYVLKWYTEYDDISLKVVLQAWNPPESARIYMGVPLTPLKQPEVCNAECISDCFGRFSYQIRETLADKSVVVLAKFTPIDSNARIYSEATITRVIPVGGSYAEWAALPKLEDLVVDPLLLYGDNRVFTMFPVSLKRDKWIFTQPSK